MRGNDRVREKNAIEEKYYRLSGDVRPDKSIWGVTIAEILIYKYRQGQVDISLLYRLEALRTT